MLRAIQRHRDVYQDYGREFRRTKVRARLISFGDLLLIAMRQGNVQAAVDQANLLSGVRNDIESVLPCQSLLPGLVYLTPEFLSSAYKSSAAEALLVERGRIDSSHQMMDDTIE